MAPNLGVGFRAVALYDMDLAEADESAPLDEVEMERGDAMWFSPLWYQNVSPTACHPCNWRTLSCPNSQHKALTKNCQPQDSRSEPWY